MKRKICFWKGFAIKMKQAGRYLLIVIGNFMVAFGLGQMILPNSFIAGGVTGLGLILQHFITIDIAILTGIVNTVLFGIGAVILGKEFAFATALSAAVFPVFLKVCNMFLLCPEVLEDPLLAALLGAFFIGSGIGIIIRNNGSTGGVDVIALVLHKYLHIPVSRLLLAIDVSIISLQIILNRNDGVIYGLIVIVLTSFVLNYTLIRGNEKVQVLIISQQFEQIREMILHQCDTGATMFQIETGYQKNHQKALMTIMPHKKLEAVKRSVKETDPTAFIIVSIVQEVNGKGYSMAR